MEARDAAAFGSLLRRMRRDAELTQEELAERAGLSVRGIGDLERGVSQAPYRATVLQLADALDATPSQREALLQASRRGPTTAAPESCPPIPIPATPLLGRDRDLADVLSLLAGGVLRLVTLTGPGGVGKTRLALEIARRLQDGGDIEVRVVTLAPLRDPSMIASSIAKVVGLREVAGRAVVDSLGHHLRDRRIVLLLDNFEHLLEASDVIAVLLARCPQLRVLATSRAALHIQGEQEYPLRPLETPNPRYAPPPQALTAYPAIELFVQRAMAVRPDFRLGDANAATVTEICYRLDGLPLAVELAAARIKVLSPQALLARLDPSLPVLTGGPRDLPARLRTMHDAVAWSYNLLDPAEQVLFHRLAVFSGGWTLEAADELCRERGDVGIDTLEALTSLVDKSLLLVHETGGVGNGLRFGMLETIREFAHDRLASSPEHQAVHRAHARYFLGLITEAGRHLSGPDRAIWLDRLEAAHANMRAALRFAAREGDVELGLRFVSALWPFWLARSHYREAQKWIDTFLSRAEAPGVPPVVWARALCAASHLASNRGDNQYCALLAQQALVQAGRADDDKCAADALWLLGAIEQGREGYVLAERQLRESLAIYRRLDDRSGVCATLSLLAGGARFRGEYEKAVSLYQEALALAREIGDSWKVAAVLASLGNLESERGRPSQSAPYYEESLALRRLLGDRHGLGDVPLRRAEAAVDLGRFREAMDLCEEALSFLQDLGSDYAIAYVLLFQTEAAIGLGNLERAEELAARARGLFRDIYDQPRIADILMQLGDIARERKDYERAQSLYQEGLAEHVALSTRPRVARCLEHMVLLARDQGLPQRAAVLHGAATSLRAAMASEMPPAFRPAYEQCLAAVRDRLGAAPFASAEATGRAMTSTELLAFINHRPDETFIGVTPIAPTTLSQTGPVGRPL